jgi:hypothetical protein
MFVLWVTPAFAGTYYASPSGTASWSAAQNINTPCSLATANTNASAGNTVYLRGGTYTTNINPSNSGNQYNPIEFAAYKEESPLINVSGAPGVRLVSRSWIKVTGLRVTSNQYVVFMVNGASYNELSYNEFYGGSPGYVSRIQSIPWGPNNSVHNWFHHNTFHTNGSAYNCNDNGALMYVGGASSNANDGDGEDNYNTFENNIWYHGGHHTLSIGSRFNVIKNDVHWNPGWMTNPGGCPTDPADNGLYGNRLVMDVANVTYDKNPYHYNLWEGNRLGHAAPPPDDPTVGIFAHRSQNIIVRYNALFNSAGAGVEHWYGNPGRGMNSVFYNNTFYYNGINNTSNLSSNLFYHAWVRTTSNVGLVYKNNLFYRAGTGDIGGAGAGVVTDVNNWKAANGNPLFVNPDISNSSNSATLPNLNLQSGSGAIDGGIHLTTASGSGSNSTTLTVADAMYFQDGTWGSDLARGVTHFPDWIAIGTVDNVVEIQSINYKTNAITLKSQKTWNNGSYIWLYKRSDGQIVLHGSAPDLGAYEWGRYETDKIELRIIRQE